MALRKPTLSTSAICVGSAVRRPFGGPSTACLLATGLLQQQEEDAGRTFRGLPRRLRPCWVQCRDGASGGLVAVKVLALRALRNWGQLDALEREAQVCVCVGVCAWLQESICHYCDTGPGGTLAL